MDSRVETLIIGGGIAGLATAWHLARRGRRGIVLVEREGSVGSQSSGRNAGILLTPSPDPLSARLARAGAAFLREPPEGFAPVPLARPCGLVLAASGEATSELRRWIGNIPEGNAREIFPDDLRRLAPDAVPAELMFHLSDEGRIDIAALLDGFARGAAAGGVALRTGTAVERLLCRGGRVAGAVLSGGEQVEAGTTVLAAGGWAGRLGESAGSRVRLRPTRRHLLRTAPDAGIDAAGPVVWYLGEEFYACPDEGGLLLSACDETTVDPDECPVDPAVRTSIAAKAARLIPSRAGAAEASFWCGLRTLTPDGRFAVGPDPDLAGLFWVAGLGGHGMACGPEVGRLAAALLDGEDVGREWVEGLAPGRTVSSPCG